VEKLTMKKTMAYMLSAALLLGNLIACDGSSITPLDTHPAEIPDTTAEVTATETSDESETDSPTSPTVYTAVEQLAEDKAVTTVQAVVHTELESMDMFYTNNSVDVSNRTTSVNKILWMQAPGNVRYASTDMITVAVEIGPVITGRAYVAPIRLNDLATHLMETSGMQSASVYISGPQIWLDSISASAVTVYGDMSGITEPGVYEIPLNCVVQGGEGQNYTCDIMPQTVTVTIEAN
jgi:hypothetical protein